MATKRIVRKNAPPPPPVEEEEYDGEVPPGLSPGDFPEEYDGDDVEIRGGWELPRRRSTPPATTPRPSVRPRTRRSFGSWKPSPTPASGVTGWTAKEASGPTPVSSRWARTAPSATWGTSRGR